VQQNYQATDQNSRKNVPLVYSKPHHRLFGFSQFITTIINLIPQAARTGRQTLATGGSIGLLIIRQNDIQFQCFLIFVLFKIY